MDKIPLNSFQILALFFPGISLAFISAYCYYNVTIEPGDIVQFFKYFKDSGSGLYFGFLFFGIILGFVLDAIRNGILEVVFDRFKKINWDFLHKGDPDTVVLLYSRYYNYYVFNINMIIALLISVFVELSYINSSHKTFIIIMHIVVIGFLIRDAFSLRGDISRITKNE